MATSKFRGKTKAYFQFVRLIWRIRTLVDLGVVGIDQALETRIDPIVEKFADVKGIRGTKPAIYKPLVKSRKLENDSLEIEMDQRSAHQLKQIIDKYRKDHDDLRYFHYANLAVALWAVFETYHTTLFEQLYRDRPELLKSAEQVPVKDLVDHRESLLEFLIERQLETVGHYKLRDMMDYYKKRLGIELTDFRTRELEKYYFLRNVVAHKTGLVRPTQRVRATKEFQVVGDEIRVSKAFLLRMANLLEASVRQIEKKVIKKFYPNEG